MTPHKRNELRVSLEGVCFYSHESDDSAESISLHAHSEHNIDGNKDNGKQLEATAEMQKLPTDVHRNTKRMNRGTNCPWTIGQTALGQLIVEVRQGCHSWHIQCSSEC